MVTDIDGNELKVRDWVECVSLDSVADVGDKFKIVRICDTHIYGHAFYPFIGYRPCYFRKCSPPSASASHFTFRDRATGQFYPDCIAESEDELYALAAKRYNDPEERWRNHPSVKAVRVRIEEVAQ